jgi:hypothetical protein
MTIQEEVVKLRKDVDHLATILMNKLLDNHVWFDYINSHIIVCQTRHVALNNPKDLFNSKFVIEAMESRQP